MHITNLIALFEKLFKNKIRTWKTSSIVLMHIFSKFTSVDRIYKINKQSRDFFSFFFDKNNPLKDDIYELQNSISDKFGQEFKKRIIELLL